MRRSKRRGVPRRTCRRRRRAPPSAAGKAARQTWWPFASAGGEAGARALERGGNAIDAAAAIQFVLNVVEPQFSGIGGGGFMMIHLASSGETFAVDSRERAPAAATPGMFAPGGTALSFLAASTSGLSVGVPGTLLGVETALRRWGTQTLAESGTGDRDRRAGFRINRSSRRTSPETVALVPAGTAAIFRPGGVPLAEVTCWCSPTSRRP
jgi:gamma-glutamyltranspeptidase/glutathione hydrolase